MKRLVIETVDELHKEIKMQALLKEKSIKDYVIDVIKEDLKKEKE